jgi:uncharacterized integral membrane protein (TIGR00698 family)
MAFRDYLPGLAVLVVVGLIARLLSLWIIPLNHLILAIILGLLIDNLLTVSDWLRPGLETYKLLLEAGIVLMGARIALGEVVSNGAFLLVSVLVVVCAGILFFELLSRQIFGIAPKLSSLLAAGSSICGVSAVVAVAGSIKAEEEQIAYAVATILLFDAITIFLYPWIGQFLTLSDQVFGMWAGLSMFSTGPVTAAGFAYSDTTGQWAVLTKVTRNVLIGVVAIGYSLYYAHRTVNGDAGSKDQWSVHLTRLWDNFPKFVVGFALVMILSSTDLLTGSAVDSLQNSYKWLFLFAFVGLGIQIQVREMRLTGVRPIAVISLGLVTISTITLALLSVLL